MYDTITGEVSQKEVTAIFERESDHINYLTIMDESGNAQIIQTTDSHPFWVVTDEPDLSRAAREVVDENGVILYHENIDAGLNGFWIEAKDLREGDVFIGANGALSTLVSKERVELEENINVYNFTVEGNHNYFVLAETYEYGQTSVLVHNAGNDYENDKATKSRYAVRYLEPKDILPSQPSRYPSISSIIDQALNNPANDFIGGVSLAARVPKVAGDFIRASLKRSKSYASGLANKTVAQLETLAAGDGVLAQQAKQMLKLIKDGKRLMEKTDTKPK